MAPSWLSVLDDTISACTALRRPDLAHRLQRRRARLLDPRLRVVVMGLLNQGKSQLINALVNAQVCAVGDDLTTTAPTVVQHADAPAAALVEDSREQPRGNGVPGPFRVRGQREQLRAPADRSAGVARTPTIHRAIRGVSPAVRNHGAQKLFRCVTNC